MTPSWYIRDFMNRPKRHRDNMTLRSVIKGCTDPDEAIWELNRKPHIYYW